MSLLVTLFTTALIMVVPLYWTYAARRAIGRVDGNASSMAARLGLRVVEGDASLDLARELRPLPSLISVLKQPSVELHHVRLEGQRGAHRVEIVHFEKTQTSRSLVTTVRHARDVRVTVHTRRPIHSFELTSPRVTPTLALPAAGSLPGGIMGPCTIHSTDIRALDAVAAELATLAQVAFIHIAADANGVSLIEPKGTALIAMQIDRLLPIVERLVTILEGGSLDSASTHGPTTVAPAAFQPPVHPIDQFYGFLSDAWDRGAASLERAVSLLFGAHHAEERRVTELGGLVDVSRTPWSRLVVREHGFEWRGLFRQHAVRYDAVTGHEYRDGVLTVWHAGQEAFDVSGVLGTERVWRILSGRSPSQR